MSRIRFETVIALLMCMAAVLQAHPALTMADAANAFLSSLTSDQRSKAVIAFDDDERMNWHYVPRSRKGISLKEMNEKQRALAREFLKSGLSQRGYLKASTIIELEKILYEMEGSSARDRELYYFTIFGTPGNKNAWAWRVEGHHLSLNFTVVNCTMVATAPSFLGANPAEVRSGAMRGTRALAGEDDKARELVQSLDNNQRKIAIFRSDPYSEIQTRDDEQVKPLEPVGIVASQLNDRQRELLLQLLQEYASTLEPALAAERIKKLHDAGIEKIRFGWAGGIEKGQPNYYRIQGPTFLVEFDNTQDNANHTHTVWRDFEGDFGRDLLREHYRNSPHHR